MKLSYERDFKGRYYANVHDKNLILKVTSIEGSRFPKSKKLGPYLHIQFYRNNRWYNTPEIKYERFKKDYKEITKQDLVKHILLSS